MAESLNILIYGSKGWIGGQFVKIVQRQNIQHYCASARGDDEKALIDEIVSVNPTHVVSFIGRTHGKVDERIFGTIDYLEQKGKLRENVRDNLFAPLLMAEICKSRNIHFTYLGTGCIFVYDNDHRFGDANEGFDESSQPNFFGSAYSIVKGFTDRLMNNLYGGSMLNLRIRMPISDEFNPRNFITKITHYERICSIPNSMTVLPELLPIALDLMKKKHVGTLNFTNPGVISHNTILSMYQEIVDPNFTWKNFSAEEQRLILAADRSNNCMDTILLKTLYPNVRDIEDAVRDCLHTYKTTLSPGSVAQKKVVLLVTGGCGFIGSNFINHYFPKGKVAKLVNLDALYYCAKESNVNDAIRADPRYILAKGNLQDARFVESILNKHEITHIMHFAAQSHVHNSFSDSIMFTNDNVLGTHVLLEECRRYGKIQKFIHVSTDEVYGESMNSVDEKCKTEHSVLCPTNPYAATKAGAELIAQSYFHSYKLPIAITRGNNVYGPNQYPEKLIPFFIKLLQENKRLTIHGKGTAIRGFIHVFDAVEAYECIFEKGTPGEIYNIGCAEGMEHSVMDIAKMLIKMMKKTEDYDQWIEYVEDRPFNDQRYYCSNDKVTQLGWNLKIKIADGLKHLIAHS